jgi:GcrA cell cycle regulator
MDWTEERVETLKTLWQSGCSASQVARQLGGVSRNAVIGKVHRLGLAGREAPARPRLSPASTDRIRRVRTAAASLPRVIRRFERPALPALSDVELAPTATIHTLTVIACRWPIGDPQDGDFGYCGRARVGAGSYCQDHAHVAGRHRATPRNAPSLEQQLLDSEGRLRLRRY